MTRYQAKLERKQSVLNRIVDIGVELFAMSSSISYAVALQKEGGEQKNAVDLAESFCIESRRRIEQNFNDLFSNQDELNYRVASKFLKAEFEWFEGQLVQGIVPSPEELEKMVAKIS